MVVDVVVVDVNANVLVVRVCRPDAQMEVRFDTAVSFAIMHPRKKCVQQCAI